MFSKVLLAIDFSEVSLKTIDYAKKLKKAGLKEVIIVFVVDSTTLEETLEVCEYKETNLKECIKNTEENLINSIKQKLDAIGKGIGVKYKVEVRTGKPFINILNVAKENNVDLIIMGAHGKGKIEELMIGSVSENVIRHSNIPVLIVR